MNNFCVTQFTLNQCKALFIKNDCLNPESFQDHSQDLLHRLHSLVGSGWTLLLHLLQFTDSACSHHPKDPLWLITLHAMTSQAMNGDPSSSSTVGMLPLLPPASPPSHIPSRRPGSHFSLCQEGKKCTTNCLTPGNGFCYQIYDQGLANKLCATCVPFDAQGA